MRYGADMSLRNTHKDTPGMVAQDNNVSIKSLKPYIGFFVLINRPKGVILFLKEL